VYLPDAVLDIGCGPEENSDIGATDPGDSTRSTASFDTLDCFRAPLNCGVSGLDRNFSMGGLVGDFFKSSARMKPGLDICVFGIDNGDRLLCVIISLASSDAWLLGGAILIAVIFPELDALETSSEALRASNRGKYGNPSLVYLFVTTPELKVLLVVRDEFVEGKDGVVSLALELRRMLNRRSRFFTGLGILESLYDFSTRFAGLDGLVIAL
jgi:hypothetical protein